MNKVLSRKTLILFVISSLMVIFFSTCSVQPAEFSSTGETWGIYQLDLETGQVHILYGAEEEISALSLDAAGDKLVFSQMTGGTGYEYSEIYTLSIKDRVLSRLTDNSYWDLYPVWSPDGSEIAFLSWEESSLDIYLMNDDGNNQRQLYDSGFHDADIDWVGDKIVFTSQSRIWIMDSDGKNPRPVTDPPRAGEWGQANLPFGDYDPRLSPDGTEIIFSRMIGVESTHGNYDIYRVNLDGSDLLNLTKTGYSQGLTSWSPAGNEILFIVAAVEGRGVYDLYTMNSDGSEVKLRIPESTPPEFLIHSARYANDSSTVYLVGQWWEESK
jgi:Tol biopolymer transport system component